jgi:hypothetical protein
MPAFFAAKPIDINFFGPLKTLPQKTIKHQTIYLSLVADSTSFKNDSRTCSKPNRRDASIALTSSPIHFFHCGEIITT